MHLKTSLSSGSTTTLPCTLLVGAGVVGRAILDDHLQRGLRVLLLDIDESALRRAADEAAGSVEQLQSLAVPSPLPGLAAIRLGQDVRGDWIPQLLIESIPENLELKRAFFASASQRLGDACTLGSNTSNLRVAEIFDRVGDQKRCLGVHFFMPVAQRPLVELIPCETTDPQTVQQCRDHARRLDKETLVTRDSPGFVVNRMLVPYLNQALLLLGRGAAPELVASAAERFGMPLSPLELIDLIGIRTAFDSGRVFWRSFPKRIDPAPILSGMIKAKRLGAGFGGGFFAAPPSRTRSAAAGQAPPRPHTLAPDAAAVAPGTAAVHPDAAAVIERYQRDVRRWSEAEVLASLSLPMWIEAAEILAAGVVDSFEDIERGLRGGLAFRGEGGFFAFFDRWGGDPILARIEASTDQASRSAPGYLVDQLRLGLTPTEAIQRYTAHGRTLAGLATAETKT